jgi:hypothetical protein
MINVYKLQCLDLEWLEKPQWISNSEWHTMQEWQTSEPPAPDHLEKYLEHHISSIKKAWRIIETRTLQSAIK